LKSIGFSILLEPIFMRTAMARRALIDIERQRRTTLLLISHDLSVVRDLGSP